MKEKEESFLVLHHRHDVVVVVAVEIPKTHAHILAAAVNR